MKFIARFLSISLIVIPVASIINVLVMWFFPIVFPISDFVAIRFVLMAFAHHKLYLISVGLLACILLFVTMFFVRKRCIVLPTLTCLYFVYELGVVLYLSIGDFRYGYRAYLPPMIISITMIVFLCIYCYKCIREKIHNRKRAKELPESTEQSNEPST